MSEKIDKDLDNIQRVVVKLGTKMITTGPYTLDMESIKRFAGDIKKLRDVKGIQVVIVTSGSIAAGMGRMGFHTRPKSIPQLQALAAIGQNLLIDAYDKAFRELDIPIAQVLLTIDDIHGRKRYSNMRNALNELISMDVVPIINENDSVGTEEVKVGDNDNLSAYVAGLVDADLLILLTDVEGLYDMDPSHGSGKVIPLVREITPEIEGLCGGSGDKAAVGGMRTKIEAAKHVLSAGGKMLIAHGRNNSLYNLVGNSGIGTLFIPKSNGLNARRHWIKMTAQVRGNIIVDEGAEKAIHTKNASLLPKGITGVEGVFEIGDVVTVTGTEGKEIARGAVQYGSSNIKIIMGHHSNEIDEILGYDNGAPVIHRDDLVSGV
ncbi:glutamate 5-kinase [Candidatus Latescibacterota bacterium]